MYHRFLFCLIFLSLLGEIVEGLRGGAVRCECGVVARH